MSLTSSAIHKDGCTLNGKHSVFLSRVPGTRDLCVATVHSAAYVSDCQSSLKTWVDEDHSWQDDESDQLGLFLSERLLCPATFPHPNADRALLYHNLAKQKRRFRHFIYRPIWGVKCVSVPLDGLRPHSRLPASRSPSSEGTIWESGIRERALRTAGQLDI
ncbi:hypothetical protein BV25DRAFT_1408873 [Artomyces pyxidatus]|uniref:Uncharacterized protein n=1 Tax=Artomyces pyxidatus TaxID=48021 RepID=A0ACB8TDW2_9AGAM|nr:hypothetical protein BV25DRAFT_1408873 [Artomyces pyxidatus]